MSHKQPEISLYCQATFDIADAPGHAIALMVAAANEIATSGFGTVVLGQWQCAADGTLLYNDVPFTSSSLAWQLENLPGLLRQNGLVKYVIISFGPGGATFNNITANLSRFKEQLSILFSTYGIDGLDFDIEGNYTAANQAAIAELTIWASSLGKVVTAAPFQVLELDWWKQLLTMTVNNNNEQCFNWWHLQCHSGADYGIWAAALHGLVPHPQALLSYGFNAKYIPAKVITAGLLKCRKTYPRLAAGFVWKYEVIKGSAEGYYKAVMAGVHPERL